MTARSGKTKEEAQAPDSGDALPYSGEEALKRMSDFMRRLLAVPKAELDAAKKRAKRKRGH